MRARRSVLSKALFSAVLLLIGVSPSYAAQHPDWTAPLSPFRIADGLYYVGSRDLASFLIVTPAGDILLNSNLPSSPPLIRRSVEQLGFHWSDIKILLISHGHVDHAGGSAAVLKQTGAKYDVMEGDVDVVESGGQTDFAFGGKDKTMQFPPSHVDRILHDGDKVTLGGTTLTAHRTPGHTRGCTTWTMQAHVPGEPAGTLRNVVIVGSWNLLPSYRLTQTRTHSPSYPGIAMDYTMGFAALHALPCDIFLGAHGMYFDMLAKVSRTPREGDRVWIDPAGYQRELNAHEQAFAAEYRKEVAEATSERSGTQTH